MQPAAYQYGAAAMAGYGGAYGMYSQGAAGGSAGVQAGGPAVGMRPGEADGYGGSIRGNGAVQGRIDRGYRPY